MSSGEGEAAYCESMPTHWVLMQFHLGHVSRLERHHERRQEPCVSARPGQEKEEEDDDNEKHQQQLRNHRMFIPPLGSAFSLKAKATIKRGVTSNTVAVARPDAASDHMSTVTTAGCVPPLRLVQAVPCARDEESLPVLNILSPHFD